MLLGTIGAIMSLNDPRWGSRGNQENQSNHPESQDKPDVPGSQDELRPQSPRPSRGKNDGPPDLDEVWRDFNRKLNRWLGNDNSGGNSGGGFEPSMKGAGIGAGLILALVALLWLGSGFFIVQEGQVGVITTFGKYSGTTKAGFQWRMPYPIQAHEVVNISQVNNVEIGYQGDVRSKVGRESLMLTEDENIIDIQFAVQYRLKSAKDYLFNNVRPNEAVKQAAETAIREIVGRSKMDYVLYEGREQIAIQAAQNVQKILDGYQAGILISNITLQNAQPPEQVQAAFDDAVKAGQDRERAKNEGQAYANDVIPKASGTAARLLQEAEGYKQRVVAQAEGDAVRFKQVLAEYSKAPGVTRDRMYLDTMQQVFANTTKVLVDSKGNNNLLYLPLDKLIQQQTTAAPSTPPNSPIADKNPANVIPNNEIPASNEAMRSRDALRGRDREGR